MNSGELMNDNNCKSHVDLLIETLMLMKLFKECEWKTVSEKDCPRKLKFLKNT